MVSSVGSSNGLDVSSIVEQLMEVERIPLKKLENQSTFYKSQISSYGSLKSAISNLKDAMKDLSAYSKFEIYSTASSDEDVFTATANHDASIGSHDIVVNTLAKAHKVASTAFADSANSVGSNGTIGITIGSNQFDVVIDSSNDSLEGIRDAINNASDNAGVKATLLSVDDGFQGTETRLVLTSDITGTESAISITNEGGSIADTLDITTTLQAATNSSIVIDGFNVTRQSNTIDDALQGVTLTLKDSSAQTVSLNLSKDTEAVKANVQKFVDSYNKAMDTLNTLSKKKHSPGDNLNQKVSSTSVYDKNPLESDTTLTTMKSLLRNTVAQSSSNPGAFSMLTDIGVKTETVLNKATDHLTIDMDVLDQKLNSNFKDIADLFAYNGEGYADKLESIANEIVKFDGIIDSRTKGINDRIKTVSSRVDREHRRLENKQEQLIDTYSTLDALVSQMQQTNQFIFSQLSNLSNKS